MITSRVDRASILKIPVTIFTYRRVSLNFLRRFPRARFLARISLPLSLYSEGKVFRGFGCIVFMRQVMHAANPASTDGRDESHQIYAVSNVARILPNLRRYFLMTIHAQRRYFYDSPLILILFST